MQHTALTRFLPRFRMLIPVLLTLLAPVNAYPCATAPGPGRTVNIVDESAVIVWDAEQHIEHFIRRADFNGDASDFGFLVPTPNVPKLEQADNSIFGFLEEQIEPKRIEVKQTGIHWFSLLFFPMNSDETASSQGRAMAPTAGGPPPVRVLNSQQVAGYDAVVLEADDAAALNRWLQAHGYSSRPELTDWLRPYVAAHWKITAFKIAVTDKRETQLALAPVRMSFTTEKPFYPYSEPADTGVQNRGSRSLRVFLLNDERMAGSLGQSDSQVPWSARTAWASTLEETHRDRLASGLAVASNQLPARLWMTAFDDSSSSRLGAGDVFFSRSNIQAEVLPPPITYVTDHRKPVPVEVFALLLPIGYGISIWWRIRSRKLRVVP